MSVNNSKLVFWICLLSSLLFLFTHIVYLVFFAIIGVKQLIIINIASVSFYFIMLLLIRFKLYNLYVVLVANEIAIYMLIATIIIGLDAGFH